MALVRSGLEEKRTNKLPSYDAELVRVLKQSLYPHSRRSLKSELRAAPPSTEAFLEVFFGALKPFSQMLRDVLGMFVSAGAQRSDENLRIAFDFDKASEALVFTIKEFREVEAFFRRVTRPVVQRRWNSNTLFSLSRDVQDVLQPLGVPETQRPLVQPSRVRDPRVREWIDANGKPDWLPFPGFPRSADPELDKALEMAEGQIHYMIAEVRKLGMTYEEFQRQLGKLSREEHNRVDENRQTDSIEDDRPTLEFLFAAHDYWPNSFSTYVCLGVEAVNEKNGKSRRDAAELLAGAIRIGFDRPPRQERTRESLEQDFRNFVNLPIWKRRYELYAVWVASRIADALQDLSWTWHPDGDTLCFPFSGAQLATLRGADGNTHLFWTEKRTKLKGGARSGRKHIQPDYRIVTAPIHRADATSLVVECKQYQTWGKKEFGAALDDYAKGCPNAPVVLVNYGPTVPSILNLVGTSRRSRTFLVGDFKPGEDAALDRFRELLRQAYANLLTPRVQGIINLTWGPLYQDLDLHLFIRLHDVPFESPLEHIGYDSTRGNLMESPWVQWPEDIRESPPGVEQMNVSRWLNAEYNVVVHDFSGTDGFPNGEVSVQVFRVPGEAEANFTSRGGTGQWWHVCRIHGAVGRIEEINLVTTECPYPLP